MIDVLNNIIHCTMPEVHPDASVCLDFQRTFRIPDTETYNFPPGMGRHTIHVLGPSELLVPMYQSEALWINAIATTYPLGIKVTYGKLSSFTIVQVQPWIDILDDNGIPKQLIPPKLNADHGFVLEILPMKLEAYERNPNDTSGDAWDNEHKLRVYVHLVNTTMWCSAGNEMCTAPLTEKEYVHHGYPWLKKYEENGDVEQSP